MVETQKRLLFYKKKFERSKKNEVVIALQPRKLIKLIPLLSSTKSSIKMFESHTRKIHDKTVRLSLLVKNTILQLI